MYPRFVLLLRNLPVCDERSRANKYELSDHDCQTVPEVGMAGKKNGELLSLAEAAGFAVFLTMDRGLQYEQNLTGRNIAILVIRSSPVS